MNENDVWNTKILETKKQTNKQKQANKPKKASNYIVAHCQFLGTIKEGNKCGHKNYMFMLVEITEKLNHLLAFSTSQSL